MGDHVIRRRIIGVLLLLLLLLGSMPAQAAVPYYTLTLDMDGKLVETQNAYEPLRFMTNFGEETLKKPEDIQIGPDGNLYIADTGNKRVLVVTKRGEYVRTIGDKKTLRTPKGVFVDAELNLYVADEGMKAVVVFNQAGEVIRTVERPTHPMFGDNMAFKPVKVAVDAGGNMYIISSGNYNGVIKIAANGNFLGYFGANATGVSVLTVIKKLLYTDEQFATDQRGIIPNSLENLTIDEKGLIYVVTESEDKLKGVRRLNVAGNDNLKCEWGITRPTSVAVSKSGTIIAANTQGEIMELTSEGNLLFLTSAIMRTDMRMGLYKYVSGIAVDDDYNIYVLDRSLACVQVMGPTEFADTVHHAFSLFQDGKYAESKELWLKAKRMNSLFSYASMGLGEAMFREENYEEAMEAFYNAGEKQGYSDAFWEVRANWLRENLGPILSVAGVLLALYLVVILLDRRFCILDPFYRGLYRLRQKKLIAQLGNAFYMLRNPFDACYNIKRAGLGGYLSGSIILVAFFGVYLLQKYASGFLFKYIREGVYELAIDAELVFLLFGLVVICFYLVCTIQEGEARFKHLFVGFAYSLTPVLIFIPISVVLSNVLTFNEAFIISLLQLIAYAWTGLLFFLSLMFLNDYSLKKTVVVLIWSVFAMLLAIAVFFIVLVLMNQLLDFVQSIFGEAVYRYVS